eukprot:TRINITY_DN2400_c0_g1_i1.p1 TRINITY_DN2400_c0_g1~~TRINITY_DN2400_c0_g1_i1.p1  ORF type:complete len:350 (-),score=104.87 TRINITY_DN2400_c0_g1_i1:95-1144(-)
MKTLGTTALLFLAAIVGFAAAGDVKCRALALEGGGSKGAYEAGVIKGLVDSLPPEDVRWDVVSGISAGSLNTAFVAKYAVGDEARMANDAANLWSIMNKTNVYQDYTGGPAVSVLFRHGIFDTAPLRETCRVIYENELPKRRLTLGVVDANKGEFIRYTEAQVEKSMDDFLTSIVGSASIPMVFPHLQYEGKVLIDGGSIMNLDIGGAVGRCREIVDDDSDIIVDVVLTGGVHWIPINTQNNHTLEMISRYRDLNAYRKSLTDLLHELQDYQRVNFRYIVYPTEKLPSALLPLDFKKEDLVYSVNLGIKDATDLVSKGPNGHNIEFFRNLRRKLTSEGLVLRDKMARSE